MHITIGAGSTVLLSGGTLSPNRSYRLFKLPSPNRWVKKLHTFSYKPEPIGIEVEIRDGKVSMPGHQQTRDYCFPIGPIAADKSSFHFSVSLIVRLPLFVQLVCSRVFENSQASDHVAQIRGAEIVSVNNKRVL